MSLSQDDQQSISGPVIAGAHKIGDVGAMVSANDNSMPFGHQRPGFLIWLRSLYPGWSRTACRDVPETLARDVALPENQPLADRNAAFRKAMDRSTYLSRIFPS
jgi:hypothetical protein